MSDIYQFNVGGTTYNLANLGLLAPVQITLTADRLYNTGDQFIYTGLLYEATETIAQGTSITIGSNAQLADCVTKQISEINSKLTYIGNYDTISAENISLPSGTYTTLCSLSLPVGSYIIVGSVQFEPNQNGIRICMVTGNPSDTDNNYINSTLATGRADLQRVQIWSLSEPTTVYLRAIQNSGSPLGTSAMLRAIRIK